MRSNRLLRMFGGAIFHRRLWQLNRHSTALGVASGIFWAWIALPLQTVGAVATALIGRGNVPLAMAFTWISNPITWLPCFLLAYEVGLVVTGADRVGDFREQLSGMMDAGVIHGFAVAGKFLVRNLAQLYPMYVGGVLLGLISGGGAYAAIWFGWRWSVARRWLRRHEGRQVNAHRARPLSRGLARLTGKKIQPG